jgi:hypothetical protein
MKKSQFYIIEPASINEWLFETFRSTQRQYIVVTSGTQSVLYTEIVEWIVGMDNGMDRTDLIK